jgi:peptidylprolyl isomerase
MKKHATRAAQLCLAAGVAGMLISGAVQAADAGKSLKAEKAAKPYQSVGDILKASQPGDWRPLNPENTLYLELEKGRVVIELAPEFAPAHADNIRTLVREGYYDGLAIVRSHENYVVQWADPDEKRELKKPKASCHRNSPYPYRRGKYSVPYRIAMVCAAGRACERICSGAGPKTQQTWLAHCYGAVGVAR